MLYLIEKDIEIRDMALTRVRCLMRTGHQKGAVHLERRVGERAEQLKLRVFLERHQIQNQNLQRPYVLRHRAFLIHHKDVFLFQDGFRRQIVLNAYGHRCTSCSLLCLLPRLARYPNPARKSASLMIGMPSSRAFLFLLEPEVMSLLMSAVVFAETSPATLPPRAVI